MTEPAEADAQPTPDENSPAAYPASDEPSLPVESDAGTTRALSALLKLNPFLDLHRKAGGDHPRRAALCFALDLLLRFSVATLLLGVIFGAAWKVLAPLPPLFQDLTPLVGM